MEARKNMKKIGNEATNIFGRLESTVRSNPLAAGAAALGIGALVGLAIPLSKTENDLMGDLRDDLLETAQDAASDAADRLQKAAEQEGLLKETQH